MSISIQFEIIYLNTITDKIDYLYKLYNIYIAFSQNYIIFVDNDTKKVIYEFYHKITDIARPNLCPYNDKIIFQFIQPNQSYYDIFNLQGKKLTNTSIKDNDNYLITFNQILYSISICKNILYIYEPNHKLKCIIRLNFDIIWNSNPINYNDGTNDHIIILTKNISNSYKIIDITNKKTNVSDEFIIENNILYDQITIGYNDGIEIYMPYNLKNFIIGKVENINSIYSFTNEFINGNFKDVSLTRKFKNLNTFSDMLNDLKGNNKLPSYHIDTLQWIENNSKTIQIQSMHKNEIKNIENNINTEPGVYYCISSNYMEFLDFIINKYDTEFITMYFYTTNKYNIIYSNILSEKNIIEGYSQIINLDYSSSSVENYLFTTHTIVLSDNSCSKRYFPISLYNKLILDKDIYFKNIPNTITKTNFINKIINLFTKLDIITLKLDFSLSPYYKISSDNIKKLGIEYFTTVKDYLMKDIELQSNLYILWDTIINPIFNTNPISN
jgi:hypothetical protein